MISSSEPPPTPSRATASRRLVLSVRFIFLSTCVALPNPSCLAVRVIGDRFPAPVKSAILSTLSILLTRVPQFVKPFFPQLQRTFVKSLSDPSSLSVRNRAAAALGVLMVHQPRVDPLVTELTNLASTEEGDVRDSVVNGLANVVLSGGKNLSDGSKNAILEVLGEAFADTNKGTRLTLPLSHSLQLTNFRSQSPTTSPSRASSPLSPRTTRRPSRISRRTSSATTSPRLNCPPSLCGK